jgi:hypothetical protein
MHRKKIGMSKVALLIVAVASPLLASASTHSGTVAMLETWPNGNIVFTLNGVTLPCNGQAVLNVSSVGVRNMYAAVLSAKLSGRPIQVNTSACVAAEGYNPSVMYVKVDYLYVLD